MFSSSDDSSSAQDNNLEDLGVAFRQRRLQDTSGTQRGSNHLPGLDRADRLF